MANTQISFTTQKRKLNELIPDPNNPRYMTKHDAGELQNSLKKFDLASIPVIDTHNSILAGHQRIKILKQLKGDDHEIEVRVPNRDLTEDEVIEYRLRDNRNVGNFDYDSLANQYDVEFLTTIGFTEEELLGLFPDEFEQEFDSYTDDNAEFQIVPKFGEQYDVVMIFSKHELDYLWLQETLKILSKKCYKNERVGQCKVIDVKDFQKIVQGLKE